jgi:hypothetical protein
MVNGAKLMVGVALLILNLAIAVGIPNYVSQMPQNTIELIQLFYMFLAIASPLVGAIER